MQCKRCDQVSDWIGEESRWRPVAGADATHAMYECEECGHHQRVR